MCESLILKQYNHNTIAKIKVATRYNEMGDFTSCFISFERENTRKTLSFTLYGKHTEYECLEAFDICSRGLNEKCDERAY